MMPSSTSFNFSCPKVACLLIFFLFIIFPFLIINRNIHCILWLILNLTTQWSQNENDNANFVYSKRFRFKWCKIHECKIQKYIIHKCYIIITLGTFTKKKPTKIKQKTHPQPLKCKIYNTIVIKKFTVCLAL